jgi:hypothetical protein
MRLYKWHYISHVTGMRQIEDLSGLTQDKPPLMNHFFALHKGGSIPWYWQHISTTPLVLDHPDGNQVWLMSIWRFREWFPDYSFFGLFQRRVAKFADGWAEKQHQARKQEQGARKEAPGGQS